MTLCSMLQREWETLKNESSRVLQRVSPRYLQHKCSKYRRLLSLALPLLQNVVNHIYYLSFSICSGSFYALLSEFIFASAFLFSLPHFFSLKCCPILHLVKRLQCTASPYNPCPPLSHSIALYLAIHRPFIRFSAFAPWSLLFRFFSKTKTPLTPLLHLVFSIVLHDYTIVLVCYILLPLCVFKYASCMY